MPNIHKTTELPRFSAAERVLLVALIHRREATATALAGAVGLSVQTTRHSLRRFESLGAAVCFSRTSIDGRSVHALWSASATLLDMLAESGMLPMAQALVAPTSRGKVLTALRLRPGLTIGEIAHSRRSLAEALATITLALTEPPIDPLDQAFCFRWLVRWSFNSRVRVTATPEDEDAVFAITWIAEHSLPISALTDPKNARRAYNSTTTDRFGKPYAVNTYRNKKKGLNGAINYAIEMGRLDENPLERISTSPPKRKSAVDRTAVVNPEQARLLIDGVRGQGQTGPRLVAFFALMYFAGLRPSEALALRIDDCDLPEQGWGSLRFAESVPYANAEWTDTGETSPRKSLKHRAQGQSRTVPACPELVRHLRTHIEEFGTADDGRLFFRRDGGPIRHATYAKIWARAREAVLTAQQVASSLGRRPYDLRHAAVSTWLNAGVPAPQVAEWAGHSVEMLLSTYAKCIDGPDQDALAKRRIDAVLGPVDSQTRSGTASFDEKGRRRKLGRE